MAEFQFAKPGLNSVGQYQISGIPYASASIPIKNTEVREIIFPAITKFVTVSNDHAGASSPLRVGFSENGVTANTENHYFLLDNGESYTGEWRVRSIYMQGDSAFTTASVIAGLTMIETNNLVYSGSANWSASDGSGLYNGGIG